MTRCLKKHSQVRKNSPYSDVQKIDDINLERNPIYNIFSLSN